MRTSGCSERAECIFTSAAMIHEALRRLWHLNGRDRRRLNHSAEWKFVSCSPSPPTPRGGAASRPSDGESRDQQLARWLHVEGMVVQKGRWPSFY